MKNGIAVAGNIVADYVKRIDTYPSSGMLTNITGITRGVGGIVPNVLINLAKLGGDIPLTGIGCMGRDDTGDFILGALDEAGIDTRFITRLAAPTSYTDVMNAQDTGERTFFHCRGANAEFSPAHIPLDSVKADILHIGYLLLLDVFDSFDPEYGTVMARFLHDAQQAGFLTSIDCVSDQKGRAREVTLPALKYCDYVIVNEIEACAAWGIPARDENGVLLEDNIRSALEGFMREGVSRLAVIHCPEAGFSPDKNGVFTRVPSLKLPENYIKGSVGAGDAFCAGCLRAIYNGKSAEEMLTLAAACAAANLSEADSVSGMRSEAEVLELVSCMGLRS